MDVQVLPDEDKSIPSPETKPKSYVEGIEDAFIIVFIAALVCILVVCCRSMYKLR